MGLSLLLLFSILISTTNSVKAHNENELHKMCKKSTDYLGCIKTNQVTIQTRSSQKMITNDWRSYGPLMVNWRNWRSQDGNHIVPTLNKDGKPLYIALSCNKNKINVRGSNGIWRGWQTPSEEFEYSLLIDFCENR